MNREAKRSSLSPYRCLPPPFSLPVEYQTEFLLVEAETADVLGQRGIVYLNRGYCIQILFQVGGVQSVEAEAINRILRSVKSEMLFLFLTKFPVQSWYQAYLLLTIVNSAIRILVILCRQGELIAARLDVVQDEALVILRDFVVNRVAAFNALAVKTVSSPELYGFQIFRKSPSRR
ncbi:MAG: hypothetical protein ACLR4Z_13805 [Butyricicoccaceae bacterium]